MRIVIAVIVCVAVCRFLQAVYRRRWDEGLSVSLKFDEDYIEAGGRAHITEIVTNEKRMPLTALHLKFATSRTFVFEDNRNAKVTDHYHRNDGFIVMGRQRITRRLAFTAPRRGYYSISGVKLMTMDFFMSRSYALPLETESWLYVLPEREVPRGLDVVFNRMFGEMNARISLASDPCLCRGIREYMSGDPVNCINWKATARLSDIAVNIYEHVAQQRLMILLNLDTNSMLRQEYIQELAIRIAGSTASFFVSAGIPVALCSNGADIITEKCAAIPFGASMLHVLTIDKCLARISCRDYNGDFLALVDRISADRDTDTTYVIVSSYCKDDLLIKLDYLCENGVSLYMISPNFDVCAPTVSRSYIHSMEVILDEA